MELPIKQPLDVLHEVFGHAEFRGLQEDVVRHVTDGGDAVVLFPTGAGKSVCYQVPALCRPGVAIVVSPLIALMRDQVEALRQAGVAAAMLNSSLTSDEARTVRNQLLSGELKLLYVAPERLNTPGFQSLLAGGAHQPLRHRRGALRQPVGPRLPPRIPRPLRHRRKLSRRAAHRSHRHRRSRHPRRHHRTLVTQERQNLPHQLRPPQHLLFHRRAATSRATSSATS